MKKLPLIILTKLTGCRSSMQGHFWPHVQNVNTLGRSLLVDATCQISRLDLVVSDKKIFI